ncbi:MAG: macro domain-containing protein [Chloroflexota bacterium]
MPIQFVEGDVFVNKYNVQAFAHGCNCIGSMGAGIAVGIKQRYPEMFEEYRRRCKANPREFNPGDVFLWKAEDQPSVFNLATQENNWRQRATYPTIEQVLENMKQIADREIIVSIAMPRIGAGYGGLSWKKVRAIIERSFAEWSATLYVYDVYVPGQ